MTRRPAKREAYVVDLSPSTKAVFEKRGPVTFIRGRTSFVLTDGEAKRLYEANEPEEQPCPTT